MIPCESGTPVAFFFIYRSMGEGVGGGGGAGRRERAWKGREGSDGGRGDR